MLSDQETCRFSPPDPRFTSPKEKYQHSWDALQEGPSCYKQSSKAFFDPGSLRVSFQAHLKIPMWLKGLGREDPVTRIQTWKCYGSHRQGSPDPSRKPLYFHMSETSLPLRENCDPTYQTLSASSGTLEGSSRSTSGTRQTERSL